MNHHFEILYIYIYIYCSTQSRTYDNGRSPQLTRYFLGKWSICSAKSNLVRQIYYTLSMEKSLSLLKIMNVQTIFSPYHKHCSHIPHVKFLTWPLSVITYYSLYGTVNISHRYWHSWCDYYLCMCSHYHTTVIIVTVHCHIRSILSQYTTVTW